MEGSSAVRVCEIGYGSDEYREECLLRDKVLREPLGLSLFDEELTVEDSQIHFGLFTDEQKLIACAIGVPLHESLVKIRQVAVSPEVQRQGVGARLMTELEHELFRRGFRHFTLHVRLEVKGFYDALGYVQVGSEFEEVGLPHLKMSKHLEL